MNTMESFNPLPIGDGLPTRDRRARHGVAPAAFQSPTNRGRASNCGPFSPTRAARCPVSIPYQSGTGFQRPTPVLRSTLACPCFNPLPIGDGLPTRDEQQPRPRRNDDVSILYQSGTGFQRRRGRALARWRFRRFNPLPIGDGLPTRVLRGPRVHVVPTFQSPTNRGRASNKW